MMFFFLRDKSGEQNFRFMLLLASLVAAVLLPPYFDDMVGFGEVWTLCFSAVMLTALYSLAGSGATLFWLVVLMIPSLLANWLKYYIDATWAVYADNLTTILYFSLVGFHLARYMAGTRVVSVNVIYAAICLYMIIAVIWGSIYNTQYLYYETSFAFSSEALEQLSVNTDTTQSLFNYYSFVTLTTLGYGDIVPLTRTTQAWVAVESLVGQFYLAIVIAQLVSSYGTRREA